MPFKSAGNAHFIVYCRGVDVPTVTGMPDSLRTSRVGRVTKPAPSMRTLLRMGDLRLASLALKVARDKGRTACRGGGGGITVGKPSLRLVISAN